MGIVCRALRVLCAASDRSRLREVKLAAASAAWELVGGAVSLEELLTQLMEWRPDVVVLAAPGWADATRLTRATSPGTRLVVVDDLSRVKDAIAAAPRPGGPVAG